MTEPNEKGYSFQVHESLTKYAQESQFRLDNTVWPGLPNLYVLEAWKGGQFETLLLCSNGEVLYEGGIEQIGVEIEKRKLVALAEEK